MKLNNKLRNQPCVCGSNKKLKKCCLFKVNQKIDVVRTITKKNEIKGFVSISPSIHKKGSKEFNLIVKGLEKKHNDDYKDLEQLMVGHSMNDGLKKHLSSIDDQYFINLLKHTFNEMIKNSPSKQVPTLCVLMVDNVCIYRLPLYPQPKIEG